MNLIAYFFYYVFFMQVARHTRLEGHFKVWATIVFFQTPLPPTPRAEQGHPFYSPYVKGLHSFACKFLSQLYCVCCLLTMYFPIFLRFYSLKVLYHLIVIVHCFIVIACINSLIQNCFIFYMYYYECFLLSLFFTEDISVSFFI